MRIDEEEDHFSPNRGEAAVWGKVVRRRGDSNACDDLRRWLSKPPPEPFGSPKATRRVKEWLWKPEVKGGAGVRIGSSTHFSVFLRFLGRLGWVFVCPSGRGKEEQSYKYPGTGVKPVVQIPWDGSEASR